MPTPKTPKSPSNSGKGKKKGTAKTVISTAMASKIEELIRTSELEMLLQRRNLGLELKGDMQPLIKNLIEKRKRAKK